VAPFDHPWLTDEVGAMEDAALLRPESGSPLVFTVDFITPIVDEPEDFGAIAAANAISDVYAMGGEPQIALAVCGFPEEEVSREVLARIFRGGRDKAAEAGCAVAGGHTVLDPELKYGLCVLGTVAPDRVLAQTSARPGDKLVLTKPIGAGIAAQAIKQERLSPGELAAVVASMSCLNVGARDAAHAAGVKAATDVTGFGLLGHLHNMLEASGHAARLHAAEVPCFDFVRGLAEEGLVPGGSKRNLEYVSASTRFDAGVSEIDRVLLADAQTSGGLLLAVPAENEARLLAELEAQGTLTRAVIGEVVTGAAGAIEVVPD
jgi:selenide,water dikinase